MHLYNPDNQKKIDCDTKIQIPESLILNLVEVTRLGQFHRSVHGSGHDDRCQLKHRPMEVPACQAYRWRCTNARRSAAR